jgi:hypothetical protein
MRFPWWNLPCLPNMAIWSDTVGHDGPSRKKSSSVSILHHMGPNLDAEEGEHRISSLSGCDEERA